MQKVYRQGLQSVWEKTQSFSRTNDGDEQICGKVGDWSAILQGFGIVGDVVGEPLRHILALANIKPTRRIALKDVEVKHRYEIGGADGVRTHDLLDAIEARSQLRHGPTGGTQLF